MDSRDMEPVEGEDEGRTGLLERHTHLVPRQPDQWVAFALAATSITLVFAWMWGSLVVLWELRHFAVAFGAALGLWWLAKTHKKRTVRRKILAVLGAAKAPLGYPDLAALLAKRKLSAEVVSEGLTDLVAQGIVLLEEGERGVVYTVAAQA